MTMVNDDDDDDDGHVCIALWRGGVGIAWMVHPEA